MVNPYLSGELSKAVGVPTFTKRFEGFNAFGYDRITSVEFGSKTFPVALQGNEKVPEIYLGDYGVTLLTADRGPGQFGENRHGSNVVGFNPDTNGDQFLRVVLQDNLKTSSSKIPIQIKPSEFNFLYYDVPRRLENKLTFKTIEYKYKDMPLNLLVAVNDKDDESRILAIEAIKPDNSRTMIKIGDEVETPTASSRKTNSIYGFFLEPNPQGQLELSALVQTPDVRDEKWIYPLEEIIK